MFMQPNFSNSSSSMRDTSILALQFYQDLLKQTNSFECWYWLKFNNFGLVLDMALILYNSLVRGLKQNFGKF